MNAIPLAFCKYTSHTIISNPPTKSSLSLLKQLSVFFSSSTHRLLFIMLNAMNVRTKKRKVATAASVNRKIEELKKKKRRIEAMEANKHMLEEDDDDMDDDEEDEGAVIPGSDPATDPVTRKEKRQAIRSAGNRITEVDEEEEAQGEVFKTKGWAGRSVLWGIDGYRPAAKQLLDEATKYMRAMAIGFDPWPSDETKNKWIGIGWNNAAIRCHVDSDVLKLPTDMEARRVSQSTFVHQTNN